VAGLPAKHLTRPEGTVEMPSAKRRSLSPPDLTAPLLCGLCDLCGKISLIKKLPPKAVKGGKGGNSRKNFHLSKPNRP
jgi:hypothetical protein